MSFATRCLSVSHCLHFHTIRKHYDVVLIVPLVHVVLYVPHCWLMFLQFVIVLGSGLATDLFLIVIIVIRLAHD